MWRTTIVAALLVAVIVAVSGYRHLPFGHLPSLPLTRLSRTWSSSDVIQSQDVNEPVVRVPIGSTPQFAIPGDSVEETSVQRAVFWSHWLLTIANLAKAVTSLHIGSPADMAALIAVIAASVVVGDFATGVFHWATDNYGSIKTPVFGTVCAAFQGHHLTPWTITFRSFVNNVYKICFATVPVLLLLGIGQTFFQMNALVNVFFVLFTNWWMVSQEFHKYAHMKKVPPAVRWLQDRNIILSRKEHGLHHTAPFEGHYCILTGVNNGWLDRTKFFRYLENIVFRVTGNRANSWKESDGGAEIEREALNILSLGGARSSV